MDFYIVIKVAIYNHDIFGVFDSKEAASRTARKLARTEVDDHHSFDVVRLPGDKLKTIANNRFTGQYCQQETVFSTTRVMYRPMEAPFPMELHIR